MIKSLLVLTAISAFLSFSSAESCENGPSFDPFDEFHIQKSLDRSEAIRHHKAKAEKARKAAETAAINDKEDRKFAFNSHESFDEFAQYRDKFDEQNRKFDQSQQKSFADKFDVDNHLY
ncbi:hypothetical protein PRIPAC_70281 [Pristionchus pacificus]|uniref:Uncharacterized protein n=1 Tax=Pristionchus pacificus TaxID=54126 RepID=A0A454XVW7_PRIPA|nr:hypothetical protein PRIPAC_70281 [Pristionchus pacificus]|eukprot:PDM81143.1 hypothetical protein PRIPAC_36146 [Pristionchus pacificus]